jgi:hypothetical protein
MKELGYLPHGAEKNSEAGGLQDRLDPAAPHYQALFFSALDFHRQ